MHTRDGSDAGEAEFAVLLQPGELIHGLDGRKLRVIDVVPTEDDSPIYVGMLMVEPASVVPTGD